MDVLEFEDTLEPLGTVVGALVALIGLGTLAGMPWTTNPDMAAVAVQLVGILLTIGVGVALVWFSQTD
ncbi:hypothetical protein ACKVMT_08900 [Halobacteriales archaeon Cl-PHB]